MTVIVSPPARLMFLSVHPVHVDRMIAGVKTVELRRTRPSVTVGELVMLYSTAPRAEVVGTCSIVRVDVASPAALWTMVAAKAAVPRGDYDNYFARANEAVGLHLAEFNWLTEPVPLAALRRRRRFHPPQTWHFLSRSAVADLLDNHPAAESVLGMMRADAA